MPNVPAAGVAIHWMLFRSVGEEDWKIFVNNLIDTATVVVHEEKVMKTTLSGFFSWVAVRLLNELEGGVLSMRLLKLHKCLHQSRCL